MSFTHSLTHSTNILLRQTRWRLKPSGRLLFQTPRLVISIAQTTFRWLCDTVMWRRKFSRGGKRMGAAFDTRLWEIYMRPSIKVSKTYRIRAYWPRKLDQWCNDRTLVKLSSFTFKRWLLLIYVREKGWRRIRYHHVLWTFERVPRIIALYTECFKRPCKDL